MHILFLDPFHGGSHAAVSVGYAQHSQHDLTLLTLPTDGGWRWRMRGAAITLARQLRTLVAEQGTLFDLIVTTDMLDLATFLGLTRDLTATIPTAIYFHENQLTYPLPQERKRDLSFSWINYTSVVIADAVLFNSEFHRRVFTQSLVGLSGRYYDHQELDLIKQIDAKSQVLAPGIDLVRFDQYKPTSVSHAAEEHVPIILWNSRWDYDKQPHAFFDALATLEARGVDFRLIVVGEYIDPKAEEFIAVRERFASQTLAWGYVEDSAEYARLLWQADIVVSAAIQEFFGIGLVEAMYCECVPIVPRRLSYPSLIPEHYHSDCLYESERGLVDKLQFAIANLAKLKAHDFRGVAAPYDWKQIVQQYDEMFAAVSQR
ncbi:MAG: DUF3524 domain-containing protein [Chloroflexi bacterium AL-W]|nr:DUF3524 domain-containing protein [Chloroflexi bacterium AL-N1]NOK67207.1 DUF3524 domain-containing protein [Chloroflexi bacterium AL-N10]NOK75299.1 DUF3524 domain-containing protein [Chloroflexi bacterium AL-N5]NOK82087.1 DUF3524 domain-containing protein [Chloroflexi bacterium AL-W]NOK89932.1 DUF3524 domain-containing protein [Chloroflexi bacterium AL-N15]